MQAFRHNTRELCQSRCKGKSQQWVFQSQQRSASTAAERIQIQMKNTKYKMQKKERGGETNDLQKKYLDL